MDIGTAKPDLEARQMVRHHLIDLVTPGEPFSVAIWAGAARRLVPEIGARGRLPLVVGGSGLYLATLLDGYTLGPVPHPEGRARLKEELATALSDDGARRFAPILKAQRAKASDCESFVRAAIAAYFDFLADEHKSWLARRPADEIGPHVHGETPEMQAVFAEVRDCIVEEISRGGAQLLVEYRVPRFGLVPRMKSPRTPTLAVRWLPIRHESCANTDCRLFFAVMS